MAILAWLLVWFLLSRRWAGKAVDVAPVNWASRVLVIAGCLLTFPPFMDLPQGK